MRLSNEFAIERNLLIVNSFLMYLYFFDFQIISNIPFINIDNSNFTNETTLIILLILNIYFLFRIILEWYKSDIVAKNKIFNKIDFYISLTIGIIAVVCIAYKLTSTYWIWSFPKIPLIILLAIGEFIASVTALNIQNIVFIRTKEQAQKLGLSRIPYAVKATLYVYVPLTFLVLLTTWIIIYYFANEQINLYWYIIILIPLIIHLIGLIPYFLFPDTKKLKSLQAIFDQHEIAKGFELNPPNTNQKEEICRPVNDIEYQNIQHDLKNGFSPNEIGHNGWTPFLLSVANGDKRLAKLFIEYGADINVKNTLGRSALHFAIKYNFSDFVELLIKHGVDVNTSEVYGYTKPPIIEAAIEGNINIVEQLIKAGANVDVTDINKKMALNYAEENSFGEIAKLLRHTENANKT
jgi:hypothetical protein